MKIGFIGLGKMGRVMAARLLEVGHELTVYNRSSAAAEPLKAKGATIAQQAGDVLGAEIVITMLSDDAAVEAVWIESGLVGKLRASGIHLNMASISLRLAMRMAELHQAAGSQYVSAPVFGRPPAAAEGQLDIVAAGAGSAVAHCQPVFSVLGKQTFVIGAEPYKANIVKIARNYLLATVVESLGETFALVRKSGVDAAAFLDVITRTSFNAPAYRNYGRMMVERKFDDPTFVLRLGLKDVELALEAGCDTRVPLPMADVIREQHLGAVASGFGEKEWTALGDYIAERAGL